MPTTLLAPDPATELLALLLRRPDEQFYLRELARLTGASAGATADPDGGIDVLVVGSVQASELSDALTAAAERLGRRVHPSVYTPAEFQARALPKPCLVTALLGGPLIPLIGAPPER